MKKGIPWFFLILLFWNNLARAHEPMVGKILATFGVYAHQTQPVYVNDYVRNPILVGVGALVEGDLNSVGGLEGGLFYTHRTYSRSVGAGHIVEMIHKLEVPMGYRFWLNDSLALGVAFVSSFSVGDTSLIYSNIASTEDTSARSITDYGAIGSIQWQCWNIDKVSLVLDGRYTYSFSAKSNEDANQFGFFVGLKYLIQN